MKHNLIKPQTIKVGYQLRRDTYTGKLAYVIYYDEKGVLRKEKSWRSWSDGSIPSDEFTNVPTEGFVINKKAGGYSSGWNHRQSYIRVYDPRGFEVEISVENLIYILEHTNSIKGRGLEGEFVYCWSGTELILMPLDTPDYREISAYNAILHNNNKVYAKDLVVGGRYKTKKNEDYVYLGRFEHWYTGYQSSSPYNDLRSLGSESKGMKHFFGRLYEDNKSNVAMKLLTTTSTTAMFISTVSKEVSGELSILQEHLERNSEYSPLSSGGFQYVEYTESEKSEAINVLINKRYGDDFYISDNSYTGSDKVKVYIMPTGRVNEEGQNLVNLNLQRQESLRGNQIQDVSIEDLFANSRVYYVEVRLQNGRLHRDNKVKI